MTTRQLILSFFFSIFVISLWSQESDLDSLLNQFFDEPLTAKERFSTLMELRKGPDTPFIERFLDKKRPNRERLDAYLSLGIRDFASFYPDSLLQYYEQAKPLMKKTGTPRDQRLQKLHMATVFRITGQHEKGMAYSNEVAEMARIAKDTMMWAISLVRQGLANYRCRNYQIASEKYLKALELYEFAGLNTRGVLINLGLVFGSMNNHEKALPYYLKGLELALKEKDYAAQLFSIYLSIGYAYVGIGGKIDDQNDHQYGRYHKTTPEVIANYNKALDYLLKAEEILVEHLNLPSNHMQRADLYMRLGSAYTNLRKFQAGEKYLYRILEIYNNNNSIDPVYLTWTYINFIFINILQSNPDLAISYVEKAETLASESKDLYALAKIKEFEIDVYEKKKDYKMALASHREMKVIGDSITQNSKEKELYELEAKYESEKKNLADKIAYEQELSVQKMSAQRKVFALSAGLVFSILFFLFLIKYRESKRDKAQNILLKQEVKKRTLELEDKNQKLEAYNEAKNKLFNNINHELRTPLNLISLSAEQLGKKQEENGASKYSQQIKSQVKTMSRLLEEIMDLDRLDEVIVEVKPQAIEWNSFIRQNFYMFESKAAQKLLDYDLNIDPKTASFLMVDVNRTEHILRNMIDNAIKYTPRKGKILVRSEIKDNMVEIVVADTGPGIREEEQDKIFKRYFRGSNKKDQKGYGIGLAICEEYAKLLNGRIWVESIPGEGASFFFTFPKVATTEEVVALYHPDKAATDAAPRTYANIALNKEQKPKILIAEDNMELSALLYDLLSENFEVTLSSNGKEAFELLLNQEETFQLIISDIMMPIVDGFSLLEKVRAHPQLGFMPFLFLSALNSQEEKMKAIRLGVDAFVTKPFDTEELKTRIWNMVKVQELRQEFFQSQEGASADASSLQSPSTQKDNTLSAPAQSQAIESYDEVWMRQLEEVVSKSLHRVDFKITDIAHQMLISERTLRNYIKSYTGMSPLAYLQKARLDQALLFMKVKKYKTVSEIAYAVGFKSSRNFSKYFKEEFGKLPSDYLNGV